MNLTLEIHAFREALLRKFPEMRDDILMAADGEILAVMNSTRIKDEEEPSNRKQRTGALPARVVNRAPKESIIAARRSFQKLFGET